MARGGRKSKCTPELVERVTQALALGATRAMACHYVGIHPSTFCDWMNTNGEFSEAVKKAEAAAGLTWLARIEQAASDGSWQAAAWKLERRYPDEFGRRLEQKVSINAQSVADQIAAEYGINAAELMAQAEEIMRKAAS